MDLHSLNSVIDVELTLQLHVCRAGVRAYGRRERLGHTQDEDRRHEHSTAHTVPSLLQTEALLTDAMRGGRLLPGSLQIHKVSE